MDLNNRTIALVGVSADTQKYGYRIFQDMLREGLHVRGVNPRGGEILGKRIFKKIEDLDPAPDLVVTVVPPQVTEQVVDECHDAGVREIWMQPGSESEKAIRKAEKHGIHVTHSVCIMVECGIW